MNSAIKPVLPEVHERRIAAIVLAAGFSSRMVDFKPMLPLAGATAFERCTGLFRTAGIAEVIAVLGHRSNELQPVAERCGARCVLNSRYAQGMFSSIVAGSRALSGMAEAVFILPTDIPLVRPATVHQLAEAWTSNSASIVYPTFAGRRGHPPLIGRQILNEAAQDGEEGPLSALLVRHEHSAIELPVADEAIHLDMDTPPDYDLLLSLATRRDIPGESECEAILSNLHVAQSVVRHSRKVAEIALRMASALLRAGLPLNLDLLRAGALLHDLAKGQPNHAVLGASLLHTMGFPRVAEIVGAHTDLAFSSRLDECAVVYLADKLVRGEAQVTIGQRFQPALDRFGSDPFALRAAHRRMQTAIEVARAAKERLGAPLASILNEGPEPSIRLSENNATYEASQQ